MDSKILVAVELPVLVCLFSLGSASCSTKGFQITRDSRDSFKIPPSKCDSTNQSFDYCAEYNAKKDRAKKTSCDCVCDASSSTFEFRNNAWSCQKNNETRASFGCGMFLDDEDNATKLNSLKDGSQKGLKWRAGPCTINIQDSLYIKCFGKGDSVATATSAQIQIEEGSKPVVNELELEYPSRNEVVGGIVKLTLECKGPGPSTTVGCLLVKLQGSTSCPVAGTPETTTLPTAVETLSKEIFSPPDSSAGKQTKRLDDLSVFLIVGLTISLSLLFVIVGTFVYRRNCARSRRKRKKHTARLHVGNAFSNQEEEVIIPFPPSEGRRAVGEAVYAEIGSPSCEEYTLLKPAPDRCRSEYQNLIKPKEDHSGYLIPLEVTGSADCHPDGAILSELQSPKPPQYKHNDKTYDYAKPEGIIMLTASRSSLDSLDSHRQADVLSSPKNTTFQGPNSPRSPGASSKEPSHDKEGVDSLQADDYIEVLPN